MPLSKEPVATRTARSNKGRSRDNLLRRSKDVAKRFVSRIFKGMEVPFTADQEAQLARMATKSGTDAPHLVRAAALRLLDEETRFLAAVERGIAAVERGEFIEEEEMDARLERMFKP